MKKIITALILSLLFCAVSTLGAQSIFADDEKDRPYEVSLEKTGELDISETSWVIRYTYTVTNKGISTLYNIVLEDDPLGMIIDPSEKFSLDPKKSEQRFAEYIVQPDDHDKIENIATLDAQYLKNDKYKDIKTQKETCIVYLPPIRLEKAGIWRVVDNTIDYQFTVTNTGGNELDNIALEDNKLDSITWESGFKGTLNPGQSCKAMGTYTVTDNSIITVENTARVTARVKHSKCEDTVSSTATCVVTKPQDVVVLPDMGAGLLLGIGLAGLGTFIMVMKKRKISPQ
ncbi:MAG: hypothetical protein JXA46_07235 [Dehalococcoidales bacterium]|nr:hypothetical protein [Dehalococcoidales bacterium]